MGAGLSIASEYDNTIPKYPMKMSRNLMQYLLTTPLENIQFNDSYDELMILLEDGTSVITYRLECKVGTGSYGIIYRFSTAHHDHIAIKVEQTKTELTPHANHMVLYRQQLTINAPGIISTRYIATRQEQESTSRFSHFYLMPCMTGTVTSLIPLWNKANRTEWVERAVHIAKFTMNRMLYLYQKKIVYVDIKLDNILYHVHSTNTNYYSLFISDISSIYPQENKLSITFPPPGFSYALHATRLKTDRVHYISVANWCIGVLLLSLVPTIVPEWIRTLQNGPDPGVDLSEMQTVLDDFYGTWVSTNLFTRIETQRNTVKWLYT